jgi:glycosyltransferase involved in cell wall biosynthesis
MPKQPAITYLFTTFPKATETFLQREIIAMQARGLALEIHSLWGGGGDFHGLPVRRFPKWLLLTLLWRIPLEAARRPAVLLLLLRGLATRRAPSWLNFWENMLGAGFACLHARHFRKHPPGLLHAAWGGAPATAAWLLWRIDGHRFSAAAHAYDLYEHGGDWWLREKLEHAAFIHTSTEMGRATLLGRGLPADRVHCIRRGLPAFPTLKPLRPDRASLRLVCIARLVPKKGLLRQLDVYAALAAAGIPFEARLIGDGELRGELARRSEALDLSARVRFTGHLSQPEVWDQLLWADALLHTGVIAPSGDRDGLPNVIPEAMAAGVLVVSSPAAATTEAVKHEATGLIADVDQPLEWVAALRRLRSDDALCERLRREARAWVEANYDAHLNAARLHALFTQATSR